MKKNLFAALAVVSALSVSCRNSEPDYIAMLNENVKGFAEYYDDLRFNKRLSGDELEDRADEEFKRFKDRIASLVEDGFEAHPNDSVGITMVHAAMSFGITDDEGVLKMISRLGPDAAADPDIVSLKDYLAARRNSIEGEKFIDFAIEQPDGRVMRLSDFAGRGKPCLVDFWASWCAPCKAEIPYLEKVYDKYAKRGLTIVSVAVWDNPQASIDTAKAYGIKWNQIVNAGQVPTELYAIESIPYIMLIGADGTILKRDLRGDEIADEVAECF